MLASAALDTGALRAVLDGRHPQHATAQGYLRHLLEGGVPVYVSALSLAEVGAQHPIDRLPLLAHLRLLAFNHRDALAAAELLRQQPGLAPLELLVLGQVVAHALGALLTPTAAALEAIVGTKPPFRVLSLEVPHAAAFGLTGSLF